MGAKEVSDDPTHPDTAETVHISALALLKMLRHARSGVPLEVMGLMLGTFVDDYTINVVDVFAMPQSGTSVTVESVDPVYQTKHLDLLKQTGRVEMVVGWYHSHPGFGCWLSSVDVSTQQSFEALHPRAVALVVDPIQSVKGNVMLDAFRSINPLARQTTSNMGHLVRPSLVSTVHGLGLRYYSLNCAYKLTTREQKMLSRLNQKTWLDGMNINKFSSCEQSNSDHIQEMLKLTNLFVKELFKDLHSEKSPNTNEQQVERYGRLDAKQKLEQVRTCCHQITKYCL
uniref:MPN domain-containing protein n=1 Tax=Angiostrongylus cantonensis TaxID=6313 RepID=A0A0K0D9S0_ANGCA